MDAAAFGRELIENGYVQKSNGSPYKNARAAENRYFDEIAKTANTSPDQARTKLQGRIRSIENAVRLVRDTSRPPPSASNSPSAPWVSRVPYSPAVSRGKARGSASTSPVGSASGWGYRQPSPRVSESVLNDNDLFDGLEGRAMILQTNA